MSNVPPPLLGFNNNVRHRGRIFHIQTEDSGVKIPRIVTHLFADGGRIIKTHRTDYSEHVSRPDMQSFVRGLMKEQHKGMFTALRLGQLDSLLEDVCGPFEQPPQASKAPPPDASTSVAPLSASRAEVEARAVPPRTGTRDFETPPLASAFGDEERVSERPERLHTLTNPNLRRVTPSPAPLESPASFEMEVAELQGLSSLGSVTPEQADSGDGLLAKSSPVLRKTRANPGATPASAAPGPHLTRPSSRFAAAPPKSASSIFGDGVISEQSLDEVILSYLAEDLESSE